VSRVSRRAVSMRAVRRGSPRSEASARHGVRPGVPNGRGVGGQSWDAGSAGVGNGGRPRRRRSRRKSGKRFPLELRDGGEAKPGNGAAAEPTASAGSTRARPERDRAGTAQVSGGRRDQRTEAGWRPSSNALHTQRSSAVKCKFFVSSVETPPCFAVAWRRAARTPAPSSASLSPLFPRRAPVEDARSVSRPGHWPRNDLFHYAG
jgi:hypothetical protein